MFDNNLVKKNNGGQKLAGIVNKIKNFIGVSEETDEVYDELYEADGDYEEAPTSTNPLSGFRRRSNLKVLSHPNANGYEVMVMEPRSFEESLEIVNSLRQRKSVILNLHLLDTEQSRRIVDFLSGATHAVDGHQQKVGEGVFIFAPCNVAISSESRESRVLKDAFWNQAR
jgi:cell division inhibitor SepF